MPELYLPNKAQANPTHVPVHNMSCEVMHVAANVLEREIKNSLSSPYTDNQFEVEQLTIVRNDIATGCGRACLKECGLWVETNAARIGLEVPVSVPEAARRSLALTVVSLGIDDPEFTLDGSGKHTKGVIEAHYKAAKPDATEVAEPSISDKAYQLLANLSEGNLKIALEVIGKLHIAANDDVAVSHNQHLVILDDINVISEDDILRLFLHPKMQYYLRISKLPKSQILNTITR